MLVGCFVVVVALPFIVYAMHSKAGKTVNFKLVPIKLHNTLPGHFSIRPNARALHHVVVQDRHAPVEDKRA